MKYYSLGFIFSKDLQKVLLIHKNRPDWQKGKINGIGGKIEENETPQECIVREIFEETDLHTSIQHWTMLGTLHASTFETTVFCTIYQDSFGKEITKTDEKIEWLVIKDLPSSIMSNLSWLISACLDRLCNKESFLIDVRYDI